MFVFGYLLFHVVLVALLRDLIVCNSVIVGVGFDCLIMFDCFMVIA